MCAMDEESGLWRSQSVNTLSLKRPRCDGRQKLTKLQVRISRRCFMVVVICFVSFSLVLQAVVISRSTRSLAKEDRFIAIVESSVIGSLVTKAIEAVTALTPQEEKYLASSDHRKSLDIVWLMSFPNSGTTYTMENVEHMSNASTATNYLAEVKSDLLFPLHDDVSPLLINPDIGLPQKYILTKTHCTGYCDNCHHSMSVHTFGSFVDGCRSVGIERPCGKARLLYDTSHVKKFVHLVRDPFSNAVARMHLGLSERAKPGYTDQTGRAFDKAFLSQFDDTQEGLTAWCTFVDDLFHEKHVVDETVEKTGHELHPKILETMKRVPCHSEIFRYVQWHNLASKVKTMTNESNYHVLHYEDYTTNYDQTVSELMDFLQVSTVQEPLPFNPGKNYGHLFTLEQKTEIAKMIKYWATEDCWAILRRYLVDYLDDEESSRGQNITIPMPRSQIVWLASFGQSGAVYTHKWYSQLTMTMAATNERKDVQGDVVTPIFDEVMYSPYALSVNDETKRAKYQKKFDRFVLTRTMCYRTCDTCDPIDDYQTFHNKCRFVTASPESNHSGGSYNDLFVDSAVIQLRNPFDVIRSRVNRGIVLRQKELGWDESKVTNLKNTREALLSYCKITDSGFKPNNINTCPSSFFSSRRQRYQYMDEAFEAPDFSYYESDAQPYKDIPCYWDWMRYIQWHNYLLEVTKPMLNHVVYFEDFLLDRKRTLQEMATFLDSDAEIKYNPPFNVERARHLMLYTATEKKKITDMVARYASPEVQRLLSPYFIMED